MHQGCNFTLDGSSLTVTEYCLQITNSKTPWGDEDGPDAPQQSVETPLCPKMIHIPQLSLSPEPVQLADCWAAASTVLQMGRNLCNNLSDS